MKNGEGACPVLSSKEEIICVALSVDGETSAAVFRFGKAGMMIQLLGVGDVGKGLKFLRK